MEYYMFLPFTTVHGIHILSLCVCVFVCLWICFWENKNLSNQRILAAPAHKLVYLGATHTHTHHSFHSLSRFCTFQFLVVFFLFLFDCYKRRQIISTNYFSIFGLMKSTHKQTNHTGNKPSMLLFDHLIWMTTCYMNLNWIEFNWSVFFLHSFNHLFNTIRSMSFGLLNCLIEFFFCIYFYSDEDKF